MKALFIALSLSVVVAAAAFAPSAEAAYIPPDAPWTIKAFCIHYGCPVYLPTP